MGHFARGSNNGHAVLRHGFYYATAALAAVADRVKPVQARVFEPGGVQMSAFVLGLKEIQGLFSGETAAAHRVVLQDKVHKGLADDHAYLGWLAWVGTGMPASAFVYGHIGGALEYQVTSHWIGNNLLQVLQGNFPVQSNNCPRLFAGEHLSMIVIGQPLAVFRPKPRKDMVDQKIDILIGPAAIYVSV